MRAPIDGPLLITQTFASLKGGPEEAYTVNHDGIYYRCIGHAGIDINCPVGTPVIAMKVGVLRYYGPAWGFADDGYGPLGLHAVITVPTGEQHWYAHLSSAEPLDGVNVLAGTMIGSSGATGAATGPHLHVAWRPAHYSYHNGFDGFDCWLTHLDSSAFALVNLNLV